MPPTRGQSAHVRAPCEGSAGRPTERLRRWSVVAALLLCAAGITVYANSFRGVFLFDDTHAIVANPHIRHLWPIWGAAGHPPSRLLVNVSLAVNYALGEYDTRGYHAFNLAVHVAAGLLLLGVVRRTLTSRPLRARFGRAALPLGLLTALIWLVHPLQTQAVTYVIQRAESMAGLFYLLTLYCAIRAFGSAHRRRWYAAAAVACGCGMATKPVMVTCPLLVLLYDRTFAAGSVREALRRRRGLYWALTGCWVILLVLVALSPASETAGFGMQRIRPWEYALTQPGVLLHYLRLTFLPIGLCLDYDWPVAHDPGDFLPQGLIVALLLAGALWAVGRNRPAGFAVGWSFLILAPTSSIMPLGDAAFEHRMYLPLAGIVALVVLSAYRLVEKAAEKLGPRSLARHGVIGLTAVLVSAVIAALGWATINRNRGYHTAARMWRDVLAKRPDNARAHYGLAVAFDKQGRDDQAMLSYRRAIECNPRYADAHNNLAVLLAQRGSFLEAAEHYRQALSARPNETETRFNLALALLKLGRLEEAANHYRKGLPTDPRNAVAHNNLGVALDRLGQRDAAREEYALAVRLAPDYVEARGNLAAALAASGQIHQAIGHYRRALEQRPRSPRVHFRLAALLTREGEHAQASRHYRRAIRLRPDWPAALNNLAWLLATSPQDALRRGPEAVALAERACELTGRANPRMLVTLAAAYAESGRFPDALDVLAEASECSAEEREEHLRAAIRAHRRLYEQGRAFRATGPADRRPPATQATRASRERPAELR